MRADGARASSWPEADALFRSDPRWIGSDDASSIELSPGRILWLFGDTFIAERPGDTRATASFPRNTVGIQTGRDPSSATIAFRWATTDGRASSFFETPDDTWYWPLHGARVDDRLLLFMMHVRSPTPGGAPIQDWLDLGSLAFFDVFGWTAIAVDNPDDDPADWAMRTVAIQRGHPIVGASVLVDDGNVLAYCWDQQMRISLARWPAEDVFDAVDRPEWWTSAGWRRDERAPLFDDGATEFSVHRDPASGAYRQIQTMFEARGIGVREAEHPEGPWSPLELVYRPEESERDDVILYAAKAHPELSGADLVLTYASNADAAVCLADQSIYYPRFVRLSMETA